MVVLSFFPSTDFTDNDLMIDLTTNDILDSDQLFNEILYLSTGDLKKDGAVKIGRRDVFTKGMRSR